MTNFCRDTSGLGAKLYRNTGTVAAPVWSEVVEARDIKVPMGLEELDDTDRGSLFKLYEAGLIDLSFSFKLSNRKDSTNVEAIRALIFSRCAEEFWVADGPSGTTGTEGVRMGAKVFTNDLDFPLSGAKTIDCELKPSYFEDTGVAGVQVAPSWYEVP